MTFCACNPFAICRCCGNRYTPRASDLELHVCQGCALRFDSATTLPMPQCSNGTSQSRHDSARPVKVIESAGHHGAMDDAERGGYSGPVKGENLQWQDRALFDSAGAEAQCTEANPAALKDSCPPNLKTK